MIVEKVKGQLSSQKLLFEMKQVMMFAQIIPQHQGVRAALCWTPELAALAKQHNNANVLSLPARFISVEEAKKIVEAYLDAEFEGGRHQRRIDKIACR